MFRPQPCGPWVGFVVAFVAVTATFAAAAEPVRYFDDAARKVISHLEAGDGWAVVADRRLVPTLGTTIDCVRYRVATNYQAGVTPDGRFVVEVALGRPTPWISTAFGTPTQAGPTVAASHQANLAIAVLDQLIPLLQQTIATADDADCRELGVEVLVVYGAQRAALADLVSKELAPR